MPIPQLTPRARRGWKDSQKRTRYGNQRAKTYKNKLVSFLLFFITLSVVFSVFFILIINHNLPDPLKINERQIAQSTVIFDRTGEHALFQLFNDIKRTSLPLDEIPLFVQQATLVAEDRDFYKHKGLKLTSIIRAAIFNIIKLDPKSQGGSTITQQFVKNAILTPEKTYTRKLKELMLAYKIEKNFSKKEILNLYFNEIPYGSTAYGVEAASQTYFGKNIKEINLAEGALLAALPKAPTFYSPYGNNKDKLILRQQFILNEMVTEGYINEEEARGAKQFELKFKPAQEGIKAPHFVFYLKEQLAEQYGERFVEQGGLKIISTIDLEKQQLAEKVITEFGEKNEKNFNATNAALVSIDPKTGQILAMVGSRDYFDTENDGNVNVATRPRQPGSSFKPFVYATAFEKGYTPEMKLFDVETTFKTAIKDYRPKNYNDKIFGLVSIRQALAGSLNIPAVKMLYMTGIDDVLKLAKELGYTTLEDRSRFGLSLVLGGAEVKLLEHVSAFGAFAREGEWFKPTGFLKIEDGNGRIIKEFKKDGKKNISTNVARNINGILSDNNARAFTFGTQNYLTLNDRPVAAKTGTTNNFIDAWTIGYTPSLVAGVWVGNNDNTPMNEGAAGGQVAAPIWQAFMNQATKEMLQESFTQPEKKEVQNPALRGEGVGEIGVEIDTVSGKLATEHTPQSKRLKKTYFDSHSILYYINKNNPNGPPPNNPASDPQFANWEKAIMEWAEENEFLLESPPTEYDDVHIPELFPEINILSPQKNKEITDEQLLIDVELNAVNRVAFVDYFIDGRPITRTNLHPFGVSIDMTDFDNGWHTLSARVNDSVGSQAEDRLTFLLNIIHKKPGLLWIQPTSQSVLTLDNFPITIKFKTPTPAMIDSLTIKAKNIITGEKINITTTTITDNQERVVIWEETNVTPGDWQLIAEITEPGQETSTKNGPSLLINPRQTIPTADL